MKKILLLLVLISGLAQAQTINIPDVNFKARLLAASATNAISIDISDKSQGIYFLKVTTTDGIKVERIIKQ